MPQEKFTMVSILATIGQMLDILILVLNNSLEYLYIETLIREGETFYQLNQ